MGTREVAAEPPTRWASADDGLDGVRERLALAMDRTGQSRRSLATAGGFDRQAVGRFLSSERVPSASVFIAIAGTLGVSLEWLLTGKGPETLGAVEHIGQALPGFLVRLNESGLGSWASRQPPTSTPTLAEAVKALEDMQAAHDRGEPFYTNEGVPVIRWVFCRGFPGHNRGADRAHERLGVALLFE